MTHCCSPGHAKDLVDTPAPKPKSAKVDRELIGIQASRFSRGKEGLKEKTKYMPSRSRGLRIVQAQINLT